MEAEIFPVLAMSSLLLWLLSGSSVMPERFRPWSFWIAVGLITVGLILAIVDTAIWFAG